ncbi:MAG: PadR family transcriptional regulator [Promethearchaeota archaeon]
MKSRNTEGSSVNLLESLPIIRIILLVIIAQYPNSTGYEMMSYIQKQTNNYIIPKSGTIYSELRKMESETLVKSTLHESGRTKRKYELTKHGKVVLDQLIQVMKLKMEQVIFPIITLYEDLGDN